MERLDRITSDANIMAGLACIRGMRIPVSVILGQLAHGATEEEILADYPDLEADDIRQANGLRRRTLRQMVGQAPPYWSFPEPTTNPAEPSALFWAGRR